MIASVHFKRVFAKSNLVFFIEGEIVPRHFHGKIRATVAAEKFIDLRAAMIELPVWRLDVDRVFAETVRGFARVALIPTFSDGLYESLKFIH
jgi:hypothetical protein